jgi:hypothetical protein
MSKSIYSMAALFMCLILFGCNPEKVIGISGQVTNATTNKPLADIAVTLKKCTGDQCIDFVSQYTDKNGRYAFPGIVEGGYSVSIFWETTVICSTTGFSMPFFRKDGFLISDVTSDRTGKTTLIAAKSINYRAGEQLVHNLGLTCEGSKGVANPTVPRAERVYQPFVTIESGKAGDTITAPTVALPTTPGRNPTTEVFANTTVQSTNAVIVPAIGKPTDDISGITPVPPANTVAAPPNSASELEPITIEKAPDSAHTVAFSPDSNLLAISSSQENILLFDGITAQEIGALQSKGNSVSSMTFSPEGDILAVSSDEYRTVRYWDISGMKISREMTIDGISVGHLEFSPDGSAIAITSETQLVVNVSSGEKISDLGKAGHSYVLTAAFRPDGKILATIGNDQKVTFWDWAGGVEIKEVEIGINPFKIAYSTDGKWLAMIDTTGDLLILDPEASKIIIKFQAEAYLTSLAISPDGKYIATAGMSNTSSTCVHIFSTQDWKIKTQLCVPVYLIRELDWSPDGSRLAAVGVKSYLWDVFSLDNTKP